MTTVSATLPIECALIVRRRLEETPRARTNWRNVGRCTEWRPTRWLAFRTSPSGPGPS
jgi:hypothetical protein